MPDFMEQNSRGRCRPASGSSVSFAGNRSGSGSTAIVVLGHGSRAPGARELLEKVSDALALRLGLPVRAASLQFNRPTLVECCRELAAGGAGRITVAPYFLFAGNHMRQDIPGELKRIRKELPGVELVLAEPLGDDGRLVDILSERVETTLAESPQPSPTHSPTLSQHPIEKQSFEIIDGLLEPGDPKDPEYQVVRRVVHTTGDISIAPSILVSPDAIEAATTALNAGAAIICDVNMVATGIAPTAGRLGLSVESGVAAGRAAALARREGITRGAAAMRLKAEVGGLDGAVVAIGNAPTALFEVLRLVREEGVRPAVVVGVPVGFVGAAESKEALAASVVPHITLTGSRGGSAIAVAITNALLRLAAAEPGNGKCQAESRLEPGMISIQDTADTRS